MSQFFQIHPVNPQVRLIRHAVEIIRQGGLIVYPTDSSYALGCHVGDHGAAQSRFGGPVLRHRALVDGRD